MRTIFMIAKVAGVTSAAHIVVGRKSFAENLGVRHNMHSPGAQTRKWAGRLKSLFF